MTVTNQPAGQMPDFATLAAIADRDPVEAARLITLKARIRGNLPPGESDLRKKCLDRARTIDGRKVSWLADKVGIAVSGISRLTTAKPKTKVATLTEREAAA
jgi:hypothetical protein